ncbi:MAG: hypothetical protein DRJ31_10135 [Candidatus Methanomethylicota archaeon]|uniref:Uncharacterized protein n=1 Tax=Thermoproteota archaeon TaxID=2056631 RepID=A0A497EJN5_9CREN|nr:MAG: hypothetical protein DRJ31_10135 [Candidatus Verstraetearchaeota archaeon]
MKGISNLLSTALLILIVLSLSSLTFSIITPQMIARGGSIVELLNKRADATGKMLSIICVTQNDTGLTVILYNYGWRPVDIKEILLNGRRKETQVFIYDSFRDLWVSSKTITKGELALLFFENEFNLHSLEIIDSSRAVIRVYGPQ